MRPDRIRLIGPPTRAIARGGCPTRAGRTVSVWVTVERPDHRHRMRPGAGTIRGMSGMAAGDEDFNELWHAALADACVDPADAVLFPLPGSQSSAGFGGKTWLRGTLIDDAADVEALGAYLIEANTHPARQLRRVAICIGGRSREGLAAALRHELEHTLQLELFGEILQRLHDEAYSVLIENAGGLPGSNVLYQRIPMEADANAAAAHFVRKFFGDSRIDELVEAGDPDRAAMRAQERPLRLETLAVRMEHFIDASGPGIAIEFRRR